MLLVGHEFHPMQGLKLIGPAALLCLAAMSAATEYPRMVKVGVGPRMRESILKGREKVTQRRKRGTRVVLVVICVS